MIEAGKTAINALDQKADTVTAMKNTHLIIAHNLACTLWITVCINRIHHNTSSYTQKNDGGQEKYIEVQCPTRKLKSLVSK